MRLIGDKSWSVPDPARGSEVAPSIRSREFRNKRQHRLAGGPRVEGRLAKIGHRLAGLLRRAADMRQQHDVVHRKKRGRDVRLVGKYVETGTLDNAVLQRAHERWLVDDRAAGDVDERAFLAERGEHF